MTGLSRRGLVVLGALGWILSGVSSARADGPSASLPSVAERFAKADVTEEPDFRRHLVPLLGKQGCNGRACHGSFQGQGASGSRCSGTTSTSTTNNSWRARSRAS